MKNQLKEKKILILGATGMLGHGMLPTLRSSFREVIPSGRTNRYGHEKFVVADVSNLEEVQLLIKNEKPDYVLYASGIINKKFCEENRYYTENVHVNSPALICNLINEWGGRLAYISSESVYGPEGGNYKENSKVSPNSVYAETKVAGEQACLEANPVNLVFRVTPVGLTPDFSRGTLAEWAYDSLKNGDVISGYENYLFTPISSAQLGKLIPLAWEKNLQGIFNIGSSDNLSKYDFLKLMKNSKLTCSEGGVKKAFFGAADRQYHASMDSSKFFSSVASVQPTSKEVVYFL